jgi:predicted lipid-binding transport protein (Tim44 family)
MKCGSALCWFIRLSWPVLGGAWGAWVGFGGYLRLLRNADSFAMVFALGFFGLFAWIGLIAGMACGALIGGLFEMLLRRFGAEAIAAVSMATLANALMLGLIAALVHTSFPGLRPPAIKTPLPATASPATPNACANPPPEHSSERKSWELECR